MIADPQNRGECPDGAATAKADFEEINREEGRNVLADECKELAEEAAEKTRYLTGQIRKADQSARYAKQAAKDFSYWGNVAFASFAARNAAAAARRAAGLRLRLAEERIHAKQYEKLAKLFCLKVG